MLYSNNATNLVLGSLLNNPTLLFSDKVKLDKSDFEPQLFHKIIFVCIHNLAIKNVRSIDSVSVQEWLSNYKPQLEVFMNNNGCKYIDTVKELANEDTFEYYYEKTKMFSLLREYKKQGFNIDEIYCENKDEEEQNAKLDNWNVGKIIDWFEKKNVEIKRKFDVRSASKIVCGTNIKDYIKHTKEKPMVGASFSSGYFNSLSLGLVKGHLVVRSANSGLGKTTFGIMDLINMCSKKIWSGEQNKFVDNPYYQGKGMIIHCEQSGEFEIQPKFFSTLSKLPYYKIVEGNLNEEEEQRLIETAKITKDSGLIISTYPDFSMQGIEDIIREFVLDGGEYVFFDYVNNNQIVMAEYKKEMGLSQIPEHAMLLAFVDRLKLIAEKYSVGILTSTQLNDSYKTAEVINSTCLSASKAMENKMDTGAIMLSPRKKEMTMVDPLIQKYNLDNNTNIVPNLVHHCYKLRHSRYGKDIKIWSYLDYSTTTLTDMFCTDVDNNYLDIPKLYIKNEDKND